MRPQLDQGMSSIGLAGRLLRLHVIKLPKTTNEANYFTMKKKQKRLGPKAQPDRIEPFILRNEQLNDHTKRDLDTEDGFVDREPSNKRILAISKAYQDKLPKLLEARIPEVRDFFLREIAPTSLAIANGVQDAQEVLERALGEKPDTAYFSSKIENLAYIGLEIKIVSFITKLLKLSPEENTQFLSVVFAKEIRTEDLASTLKNILSKDPVLNPPPQKEYLSKK
jgi:hypothetical protein